MADDVAPEGTPPTAEDTAQAEAIAAVDALLDARRAKVRWGTAAAVSAAVAVVGSPVAFLFPFGAAAVGGVAAAVALPVGFFLARSAVPEAGKSAPVPEVGGQLGQALQSPLGSLVMEEAMQRAAPGLSAWADACVVATKGGAGSGTMLAFAATTVGACGYLPVFGVLAGLAPALGYLARAMAISIPPLPVLREPDVAAAAAAVKKSANANKRPGGLAILEALRASPIYRGQDALDIALAGVPLTEGAGLDLLLSRYHRLTRSMLASLGIEALTSAQTKAMQRLLEHEKASDGQPRDMVLVGWPGSGRSTFCNLLSFASVAHGEGTVYCISAEGPERNGQIGKPGGSGTRLASGQLRGWLEQHKWGDRLQEAYAEDAGDALSLARGPDVVFTDVKRFGEDILGKAAGEARGLLQRLRYVVVDHPDRLSREELVRLRVSLARLRMTARLYGRGDVTFLVMLPRLGNFQELGKWLLNNEDVHFQLFDAWQGPARVLGWVPPQEYVAESTDPMFARAEFTGELVGVLTELGVQAQQLRTEGLDPMRIAVVDALPLLGPEFRAQLAELVVVRLKECIEHTETLSFVEDWSWFGTADLRVDQDRKFDVIVTVGIGPHPEHLVASLRSVLAEDGLLCLVSDPSPVDHESVRRMREPGWDPLGAVKSARYPSIVLPPHAEALVAFQLASLFDDFCERKVPERQLTEIFPGEITQRLLDQWRREGILKSVEVFEQGGAEDKFERRSYLHQPKSNGIRPDRYDVPWGCSTLDVWEVYDDSARSLSRAVGRTQSSYVDQDRIFIDLTPMAMLRFSPNTVEVVDVTADANPASAKGERFGVRGRIHVRQVDFRSGIEVDKRAVRFTLALVGECGVARSARGVPVLSDSLTDILIARSADRSMLARSVLRPTIAVGGRRPGLRLVAGTWRVSLRESVRDVAITTGRLVEDHRLVRIAPLSLNARTHAERVFDTLATVLCFERTDATPATLASSRASFTALARSLRCVLSTRFIEFEREYRVVVVPCHAHGGWSSWGELPVAGVKDVPQSGFSVAANLLSTILDRSEGVATAADLLAVWTWARASLKADTDASPSPVEALTTLAGTPLACAQALGLLYGALGLHVVIVSRDGRAHVEVAVPVARLPSTLRALKTALGGDAATVQVHAVEGGAWIPFDLSAAAPCATVGAPPWSDQGWTEGTDLARQQSFYLPWRILIHRLRSGETQEYDQVGALIAREFGREVLSGCMELLENCDCADGCSSCCGGLGTVPELAVKEGAWDDLTFNEADWVSRTGALQLLSALLGRPIAARQMLPDTVTRPSDSLATFVTEILGTPDGKYADGLWAKLFGSAMVIQPDWVAKARWLTDAEVVKKPNAAGIYFAGPNEVTVKLGQTRDYTLEVIVHEYVHNWQFKSGKFDIKLRNSEESKQFFDGTLVIEGHATWSEHIFRFQRGMGAAYTPNDDRLWDMYKTGFFLIQGIVKAFGVRGLFRWLSGDMTGPQRSNDPRISWPFTLVEAVRAFGLESEARYGTFDGIDVDMTEQLTTLVGAVEGGDGTLPPPPQGVPPVQPPPTPPADEGAET